MTNEAVTASLEPVKAEMQALCQLPHSPHIEADRKIRFRDVYTSVFVRRDAARAAASLESFQDDLAATPEANILCRLIQISSPMSYGPYIVDEVEDTLYYLSECGLSQDDINKYGVMMYSVGMWSAGHCYPHLLERIKQLQAEAAAKAVKSALKLTASAVMAHQAYNSHSEGRTAGTVAAGAVAAIAAGSALTDFSEASFHQQSAAELAPKAQAISAAYPKMKAAYTRRFDSCSDGIRAKFRWLSDDGFKAYLNGLEAITKIMVSQQKSLKRIPIMKWMTGIKKLDFLELPKGMLENYRELGLGHASGPEFGRLR